MIGTIFLEISCSNIFGRMENIQNGQQLIILDGSCPLCIGEIKQDFQKSGNTPEKCGTWKILCKGRAITYLQRTKKKH